VSTAHLTPIPARGRRPDVIALVRRLTSAIDSAAMRVRAGRDAEAIHDLRVACRRLESALSAWAEAFDPAALRRGRRGLKDVRSRLSPAREREVLAEQFAELFAEESLTVREAGVIELERLERRVALARARAAGLVRRRRVAGLVMRVEACLTTFVGEAAAIAGVQARALALRAEALEGLAAGAEAGDAALHVARIAVKRWRYHLEAMTGMAGGGSPERLSPLRELQQCLGAVHDAAVLRDFISRRAWRARAKGRDARHEALIWLRDRAVQARWRALERLPAVVTSVGAIPRP